jgi:hypothetical protein
MDWLAALSRATRGVGALLSHKGPSDRGRFVLPGRYGADLPSRTARPR